MKRNTLLIIVTIHFILCGLSMPALSQEKLPTHIAELKIGDKLPDQMLQNILGKNKQLKLSDLYKPGVLIINFWATWCMPCIREIPNFEALKEKYPEQFNVLAVSYQDSSAVKSMLKKYPDPKYHELTTITNDKLFIKYFPHKYLPHNIWIDRNGIVRAITDEEEITEKNVLSFINNKPLALDEKKDAMSFDYHKPFHLMDSNFTYRSILTKHLEGANGGHTLYGSRNWGMTRFFAWNEFITDLFFELHSKDMQYYKLDYRIIQVHTKDSLKFFPPWLITNLPNREKYDKRIVYERERSYCYDLTMPRKVPDTLFYKYAIQDLERIFNVRYSVTQKILPCDVITSIKGSKYNLEDYKVAPDTAGYVLFSQFKLTMKSATVEDLMNTVLRTYDPKEDLWINESGINFPISLVINFDKKSNLTLEEVKQKLLEYGLKIETKPHNFPVMVLDDLDQ
ncbi:MAG: TlpA family protein disulfide reductase [Mucilaginibacter sp.]